MSNPSWETSPRHLMSGGVRYFKNRGDGIWNTKTLVRSELSAPRSACEESHLAAVSSFAGVPERRDPLGITSKLMVICQPGGLNEKGIILRNLESPQEAPTLAAGLAGSRRWLRWKRRAMEVGVALPDATILVRGLNRITKNIIENHKELNFRISLAKTTLMVESIPTEETVHQL